MSAEEKMAFARRWFNNLGTGDFEAQRTMLAPDHQFHFPLSPHPLDRESHLGAQRGLKAAIPDLSFTIEDQIVEGDKVVTRYTARGVHQAEFQGLPPTGKSVQFQGISIMRIVDGKNVEEWDIFDTLAVMQQLGAVPASTGTTR